MNKNEIKEIEKFFSLEYIGDSRIDGCPFFKCKINKINQVKNYFELEFISLLENTLPWHNIGPPTLPIGGQKDYIIFRIVDFKYKSYISKLRKDKLNRLNSLK